MDLRAFAMELSGLEPLTSWVIKPFSGLLRVPQHPRNIARRVLQCANAVAVTVVRRSGSVGRSGQLQSVDELGDGAEGVLAKPAGVGPSVSTRLINPAGW
jgi:hypothetical protein